MFSMFQRMAIRAKYNKVMDRIVGSIIVFMMDSKYFWMDRISTFHTFYNHISPFKCQSNRLKSPCFGLFLCVIFTFIRAIYTFAARRGIETFMAEFTFLLNRSFQMLCFMIAFTRAIFGFPFSTCYIIKWSTTNDTNSSELFFSRSASALRGTKLCCIKSIFRNIETFSTYFATYYFPFFHKEISYAA